MCKCSLFTSYHEKPQDSTIRLQGNPCQHGHCGVWWGCGSGGVEVFVKETMNGDVVVEVEVEEVVVA